VARGFLRFEVGDRLLKYPGPAVVESGVRPEESFFGHGLRFAAAVGARF
jgi:hypothetical protein